MSVHQGGIRFPLLYLEMETPLGRMCIAERAHTIVYVWFHLVGPRGSPVSGVCAQHVCPGKTALLRETQSQIHAYFCGALREFSVPVTVEGTPFMQRVWGATRNIAYGTTKSYAQLSQDIGCPRAARAVGQALHRNPLLLLIPCHRVISARASIGGFAYGSALKHFLLQQEAAVCACE